jgi:hypothetical protein
VDIQSGLKVFKKETIQDLDLKPTAWGFDYQFLFLAKRRGATMTSEQILFEEREHGESKVRALATGVELIRGALKLRFQSVKQDFFRTLRFVSESDTDSRASRTSSGDDASVRTPLFS